MPFQKNMRREHLVPEYGDSINSESRYDHQRDLTPAREVHTAGTSSAQRATHRSPPALVHQVAQKDIQYCRHIHTY